MKLRFFLVILLLTVPVYAMERMQAMMGTYATVSLPSKDAACADKAFFAMRSVDKTLSSYDAQSEVYRLNHAGHIRISAMMYDALLKARRYYTQSHGYFDITIGSLTRGAFHFGETQRVPKRSERRKAKIGFALLEFNATAASLKPGGMIDMGGFGKGYGIDSAAAALKRCGVTRAVAALSGDIRCLGRCMLAIQDPFSDGTLLTFVSKRSETGISTSGNYRRFVGDRSQNHLIDPKTRVSEKAFASVTLVGTVRNSDLDAWATAAAVMPPEMSMRFLASLPVGYVLVFNDGTIVKSKNLTEYIRIVKERHEND